MRILFLSQLLPYPLDAGPKVRAFHVLERLAASGHDVVLFCRARSADSNTATEPLERLCEDLRTATIRRSRIRDAFMLLTSPVRELPWTIRRDESAALHREIFELVEEAGPFDAIHSDQLTMATYALTALRAHGGRRPRLVLDQHNALFRVPAHLAAVRSGLTAAWLEGESQRLLRYERRICDEMDEVVWVTREDRDAIESDRSPNVQAAGACGPSRSRVVPICIDPRRFEAPESEAHSGRHRVTFIGGMHWPPNRDGAVWLAERVWPVVRQEWSDSVLTLVGRSAPSRRLRSERVETPGFMEDLEPILERTAVFVVPLHAGAGMRVKILEAWARGLPVVSTTLGAEGLEARDGVNILLADSAEDFSAAISRLLGDLSLRSRVGQAGRREVEERHDWRRRYTEWDQVYPPDESRALAERAAGTPDEQ